MKRLKILNLYAGIGGNRKLWGDDHDITAVEIDPDIARIYQDYFPNDTVIVADAHEYLLKNFRGGYDVIWSSPPCPTHSNARFWSSKGGMYDVQYPDMTLYQEILLLKHFLEGKWVVENVIPYYEPLIPGKKIGRHLFWANFRMSDVENDSNYIFSGSDYKRVESMLGYDLSEYKVNRTKILRNCVHPETGLHILNCALGVVNKDTAQQVDLFI